MFKLTRKKVAAGALAAGLVAMTGVGYAYWTESGTGSGSAATGDTADVTVVQTSTPSGMYPGSEPQELSGTITNPNDGDVHVYAITAEVTDVTGEGTDPGQPECTTDDYEITGSSGPYIADPDDTTTWDGLFIQLKDGVANQDNCKGATAVITYTADATA